MKPALFVATVFLALISIAHLLRFVLQVGVTAGCIIIPLWISAIACVFTGGLAIMLWLENRPK
jgi:hypothetical protein